MNTSPPGTSPLFLVLGALLFASSACCPAPTLVPDGVGAAPSVMQPGDGDAVRTILRHFQSATVAADFETIYALLSGRLRARYTVETLRRDHLEAGQQPGELLDRLLLALDSGAAPLIEGERAIYPLGGGLSIGLLREEGGWFIDRLR